MIRRPRERFLQMLIYEHYVRPHFDFFELATAERRLIHSFDRELNQGSPSAGAEELVRRWFDKAWRRAEREWADLRDGGGHAFYSPRLTDEERSDAEMCRLSLPSQTKKPPPPDPPARSQLALPGADPDIWGAELSPAPSPLEPGTRTACAKPSALS